MNGVSENLTVSEARWRVEPQHGRLRNMGGGEMSLVAEVSGSNLLIIGID